MKHICFVVSGLKGGGIERIVSGLANYSVGKGYKVSIILLFQLPKFYLIDPQIQLIESPFTRKGKNKYIYALKALFFLRKQIREIEPDSIASFGEWINPFVILACLGLQTRIIVSDRMSPALNLGFPNELARQILYKFCDGIIAQTNYAKLVLTRKTKNKNIEVINNPLNEINVLPVSKKKIIVTLGRLTKEKGHEYLIRAFAAINDPDWTLSIIGDDIERENLEQLAVLLGVKERIIFHGHIKKFGGLLAEAEIFVLPSLSEGYPNALIEAMSVPLACISSNCIAGPSDIITHMENGLLVKPGDIEELKNSMILLMNNEELREKLAEGAYKIREKLKFDRIAERFINFIIQDGVNSDT